MKKTSIALMIGLFAVGCDNAPKKVTTPAPAMDPAKMATHMGPPGGLGAPPAATEEKKDADEKKTEEEKAPAAEPATPEEPK